MPRILVILFLAFSLTAGAAPVAYAQEPDVAPVIPATSAQTQKVDQDDAGKPLSFPVSTDYDGALASIVQWIMLLFGWLVGVAAMTLDNAVYYTVVTMGNYVKELAAVGVAWRILRDVGNIVLIFGFLAVGITTILNVDWYGGGKKMLPAMLAAAVFLNFSLFITEAVIDTGNLVATQFYTQINGGRPAGAKSFDTITSDGISNKIMGQLGLQTIYNGGRVNTQVFKNNNSIIIGFMGILLFIILAFVLFSLAFVLIARFVMLIYLIILSPIGFAGYAVPQLKGVSDKWLKDLIGQTITAPILLLLLYVALAVITDANFLKFGAGYADWTGFVPNSDGSFNLTGFAGMILSFLVAMGLLIFVVITSKSLSAFGASWATKTAGKFTFGATAWGLSRTVGRAASYTGRSLRQSTTFNRINAMTGRVMTRSLDRAATGSFDVRGAVIGGGDLKSLGIDAGKAAEKGFAGARERNIKAHEEEAKRIEEAHKESFRGETDKEKRDVTEATANLKRAVSGQEETKKEHEAVTREVRDRQAEVRRIEEEKIMTPDKDARLAAARDSLEGSIKKQDSLKGDLNKLGDVINNLKKVEETAKKAAETRLKENIKESKTAYAESIDRPFNPITFIAYGPDTAAAARKIKASLKEKNNDDKLKDLMKKIAKEQAEAEKNNTEKNTSESESGAEKPETGH